MSQVPAPSYPTTDIALETGGTGNGEPGDPGDPGPPGIGLLTGPCGSHVIESSEGSFLDDLEAGGWADVVPNGTRMLVTSPDGTVAKVYVRNSVSAASPGPHATTDNINLVSVGSLGGLVVAARDSVGDDSYAPYVAVVLRDGNGDDVLRELGLNELQRNIIAGMFEANSFTFHAFTVEVTGDVALTSSLWADFLPGTLVMLTGQSDSGERGVWGTNGTSTPDQVYDLGTANPGGGLVQVGYVTETLEDAVSAAAGNGGGYEGWTAVRPYGGVFNPAMTPELSVLADRVSLMGHTPVNYTPETGLLLGHLMAVDAKLGEVPFTYLEISNIGFYPGATDGTGDNVLYTAAGPANVAEDDIVLLLDENIGLFNSTYKLFRAGAPASPGPGTPWVELEFVTNQVLCWGEFMFATVDPVTRHVALPFWGALYSNIGPLKDSVDYLETNMVTAQTLEDGIATAITGARDAAALLPVSFQTADYTLAVSDLGHVVEVSTGSAATVTIPAHADVEFPLDAVVHICRMGSSDLTIEGDTGVTVHRAGDVTVPYGTVMARRSSEDVWVLSGDI